MHWSGSCCFLVFLVCVRQQNSGLISSSTWLPNVIPRLPIKSVCSPCSMYLSTVTMNLFFHKQIYISDMSYFSSYHCAGRHLLSNILFDWWVSKSHEEIKYSNLQCSTRCVCRCAMSSLMASWQHFPELKHDTIWLSL